MVANTQTKVLVALIIGILPALVKAIYGVFQGIGDFILTILAVLLSLVGIVGASEAKDEDEAITSAIFAGIIYGFIVGLLLGNSPLTPSTLGYLPLPYRLVGLIMSFGAPVLFPIVVGYLREMQK